MLSNSKWLAECLGCYHRRERILPISQAVSHPFYGIRHPYAIHTNSCTSRLILCLLQQSRSPQKGFPNIPHAFALRLKRPDHLISKWIPLCLVQPQSSLILFRSISLRTYMIFPQSHLHFQISPVDAGWYSSVTVSFPNLLPVISSDNKINCAPHCFTEITSFPWSVKPVAFEKIKKHDDAT